MRVIHDELSHRFQWRELLRCQVRHRFVVRFQCLFATTVEHAHRHHVVQLRGTDSFEGIARDVQTNITTLLADGLEILQRLIFRALVDKDLVVELEVVALLVPE